MKRLSLFFVTALALSVASAQAEYCREYTRTIRIGGQMREGVGTACLQPDGSWRTQPEHSSVYEEEIAWHEPVRDRVVYVERETPVYVPMRRPVPLFEVSFGDDWPYRKRCHRSGWGWGERHHHGYHGHGHGHGRGRWH